MSTATTPRPVEPGAAPPEPEERRTPRWVLVLGVLGVWIVVWFFTRGTNTLALPGLESTPLHDTLTDFRNWVISSRDTNPIIQATTALAEVFRNAVDWLQRMFSVPNLPRPVPEIGWFGVVALATWVGYAIANWRIALLVCVSFLSFGVFGFWTEAIDLLIVTLLSVAIAVIIGMPLAVLMAINNTANRALTLVLDLLQTMPTFVYLLPIVLFFGIGVSGAVVCTLAYALPPIIRISSFGIRAVSPTTVEATDSAGQTTWQRLTKVQLPMARKTIIVGLNQTIMAALSMATLASFIDGPGLGQPVLEALRKGDFGGGLVPGLLIVVMAIMLDRTTTAASERAEIVARGGGGDPTRRRIILGAGGVVALVCVFLSRQLFTLAEFPEFTWGDTLADIADAAMEWFVALFGGIAATFKDVVTYGLLNPMQDLLAESPWWLSFLAICALAFIAGGRLALVPTVICLAGIWYLDLWHDAMITLNMTLVATVLVMALALVFGVWMARNRAVDLIVRPVLDAAQTIPPFVYLIPVLALFGPSRFTGIAAGIVYAAPVAIKLVADGVRGVSPTTVEAARSTGSTKWQEITKVQLPMAKGSLVLATNQGLLYVLSMAVIAGMVGAGALGYIVVVGFSRAELWGKGLAAGLAIVLLGVMLDRIARAAAHQEMVTHDPTKRSWWRMGFG